MAAITSAEVLAEADVMLADMVDNQRIYIQPADETYKRRIACEVLARSGYVFDPHQRSERKEGAPTLAGIIYLEEKRAKAAAEAARAAAQKASDPEDAG